MISTDKFGADVFMLESYECNINIHEKKSQTEWHGNVKYLLLQIVIIHRKKKGMRATSVILRVVGSSTT